MEQSYCANREWMQISSFDVKFCIMQVDVFIFFVCCFLKKNLKVHLSSQTDCKTTV